uniref:Calcium-regulated heat-stable protein 1 (Trinotate prediction) n=1 Tax=Myxobolus squamalis TaxID=59785 RepID=A0A6B2GA98_MYXSQ
MDDSKNNSYFSEKSTESCELSNSSLGYQKDRRSRSNSITEKIEKLPYESGTIKSFCRSKGYGMIIPIEGSEDIFVHISEIMSDYVPRDGDFVRFKRIPIPPKNLKKQAVDVHFIHEDEARERWPHTP